MRGIVEEGAFDNSNLDDEALLDDDSYVEGSKEEFEDPTPITIEVPEAYYT